MSIDCVWLDEPPDRPSIPGECHPYAHKLTRYLSKHYLSNVALIRPPISVALPTRQGGVVEFCIDWYPSKKPNEAWDVTCPWPLEPGTKPAITVRPSIDCVGLWHGHLVDGVLSDDLG